MMKPAVAVLIVLASFSCSWAADETASRFPAQLVPIEKGAPSNYLYKVSEIPRSVADVWTKALHEEKFSLADKDAAWNSTDVVYDSSLPFRRLIWAAVIQKYFVLHYERGGRGYSTHFFVFSPENKAGARSLLWSGVSFSKAADFPALLKLLEARKVDSDPKLSH